IRSQEAGMRDRLEIGFNAAEAASHADTSPEELPDQVRKHLTEVHALESQSLKLLTTCADDAQDPALVGIYRDHLAETRRQIELIEEQLASIGANPSTFKDSALKLGALN